MNKLFTAILKAKSPGDPDTAIKTTKMTVVLRKELVNTLKNGSILGSALGQFILPKLGFFQKGKFEDDAASLQVKPWSNRHSRCCGILQDVTPSCLGIGFI